MAPEQTIEQNRTDLKTAREMAGFTLKDMYERTRISVANLEAIEKSDFHLLPVPIYARNFIKTYADALGVDSRPVLQRYESYLQSVQMKENEKISLLLRHADRDDIPQGSFGNEILLNEKGKQNAQRFGEILSERKINRISYYLVLI